MVNLYLYYRPKFLKLKCLNLQKGVVIGSAGSGEYYYLKNLLKIYVIFYLIFGHGCCQLGYTNDVESSNYLV